MDFKQIEAFVNVIKFNGFSKAAEATFITQPTISAHVNALEKELKMQLIDRTGREIMMTSEGKVFYKYALTMLNTREQAIYSLHNYSLNINGTIDIRTSNIPGEFIVPTLIANFKKKYDKVSFRVEQSDSLEVISCVKLHKGDIGFTGRKENDGLKYKLLMKDKIVLITPANKYYSELGKGVIRLERVLDEPFILREAGSATRESFDRAIYEQHLSMKSINVVAVMNNIEAIKQAVRNGMGISIISEIAAERDRIDRGYLIFDIDDYNCEREFYMVYDDKFTMSPTAETFKHYILGKSGY